jgi:hypothetical protein
MRDRRATAGRDSAEIINKSMLANGTFIARLKVPTLPDGSFRPMNISWRDDFVQCPACL